VQDFAGPPNFKCHLKEGRLKRRAKETEDHPRGVIAQSPKEKCLKGRLGVPGSNATNGSHVITSIYHGLGHEKSSVIFTRSSLVR
jgi:hypothetical protein